MLDIFISLFLGLVIEKYLVPDDGHLMNDHEEMNTDEKKPRNDLKRRVYIVFSDYIIL